MRTASTTIIFLLVLSTSLTLSFSHISPKWNCSHHLAGLILARGGSKGIPKKNIVTLNGKPLIHWALTAMSESGVFTTIWVSTDDWVIASHIFSHFPNVRVHLRNKYTATDEASSLIAVQEFLHFHPEVDIIGLIQATSPFILPKDLQQAGRLIPNYDSVFSVYRSKSLRWTPVSNDSSSTATNKTTQPLNFDARNRPRRQDWDGEMIENGMFYFAMRPVVMDQNVFQGNRSFYVEIPQSRSLEIDTPRDLAMAEVLCNKFNVLNGNIITELGITL